jgi:formamidopyrimidine-DNA glycosylase
MREILFRGRIDPRSRCRRLKQAHWQRIVQAQRATFFCPTCQRRP